MEHQSAVALGGFGGDSTELERLIVLSNAHNKNTEKLLQDYLTFIPDLGDFGKLDVSVLKAKFKDNIQPFITLAR